MFQSALDSRRIRIHIRSLVTALTVCKLSGLTYTFSMRKLCIYLGATFLTSACAGDLDNYGPPSGSDGRGIKHVCDLGRGLLMREFRLECDISAGSPLRIDPKFWGEEKPCAKTSTPYGSGTSASATKYNYDDPYTAPEYPGVTYKFDVSGNIESIDIGQVLGTSVERIDLEYENGRLEAAIVRYAQSSNEADRRYIYHYEGDRRTYEEVEGLGTIWYYSYADGYLVAEGANTPEGAPQPVELSDALVGGVPQRGKQFAADYKFNTQLSDMPEAFLSYIYEDGKVVHIIRSIPGLPYLINSFQYQEGRLTGSSYEIDGQQNPSPGLYKYSYQYQCE